MSSSPVNQRQPQQNGPDLYNLAEKIYNLGDFLLWDDRGDIGYGAYRNRTSHYYKGEPAPDHPSVWHHWPIGIFAMALGQLLGTVATLNEMATAAATQQGQEQTFNTNE